MIKKTIERISFDPCSFCKTVGTVYFFTDGTHEFVCLCKKCRETMITIEEVKVWVSGEPKYNPDFALKTAYLAISQHEEIERLKKEASEWKAFYFEALEKLKIVSVELDDALIRALKAGEPK